jgi:hypothetical protein
MNNEHKALMATARLTGIWYLALAITGVCGFMVLHPQVYATDDPATTLENLTSREALARTRLVVELLIVLSQALAAVWFYKLFKPINSWAASLIGLWGTVNAVLIMISAIAMGAALDVAGASLPVEEKVGLIRVLSLVIRHAWAAGGLFFGLWLFPMGYIIVSSGCMPRALGYTLLLGGVGYVLSTLLGYADIGKSFAEYLPIPASVGEFWIIGYLLIFGIRPALASD